MGRVAHARLNAAFSAGDALADTRPRVAAAQPGEISIAVYDDLAAVAEEWRSFQQIADGTVFQTYEWLACWQQQIGTRAGVKPAIVLVRDRAGTIVCLLPLSVRQAGWVRELTFLGSDLCDYNGPLLSPAFATRTGPFAALWAGILAALRERAGLRFDLVRLTKMPASIGTQPNPMLDLGVTVNPSGAYLTHLSDNWDSFYAAKRSSSTRRRDRTKRNRLADIGPVHLAEPQSEAETLSTLDTLMAQKGRAFARMGVTNLFARPGYRDFYRALATSAMRPMVHISRLDVGDIPAAVNLGLVFHDRYYHLQASYDDGEAAKFGPGAAHLHDLMRTAIERGLRIYDFTIGDEAYKRDWSDTTLVLYDHMAAASWRGALVLGPMLAAQKLKHTIKQTPVLWTAFSKARAFIGAALR